MLLALCAFLVATPLDWKQAPLQSGPLAKELHDSIRARWKATAKADWTGQT